MMDNRSSALIAVHKLIDCHLFGAEPWLVDREGVDALGAMLETLGLQEPAPSHKGNWRNTPLGNELQVDLLEVFLGLWDEHEVPTILADHDLIDESDEIHLIERLCAPGANAEAILLPVVKKAYFDHYRGGTAGNA